MASFGKIGEFSLDKETISNYLEHVEIFFQANGIAEDEKKVPVFLSIAGGDIAIRSTSNSAVAGQAPGKDLCQTESRVDEAFSAKKRSLSLSASISTRETKHQTRVSASM